MNIELYICEGELTDNSQLYIPDFNHHEYEDFSFPQDSLRTSIKKLKETGSSVLRVIDITKGKNINDSEPPITRYLLVVDLHN